MLLKMFQDVTDNDNFLVIESDCVIIKPLPDVILNVVDPGVEDNTPQIGRAHV